MAEEHTVVVGAGIVGVSTAYYLARRGRRVTLIDQGEVGAGASSGNAGIIAIGHPPMCRPGLVSQALKWMFDRRAPLYVPPPPSLSLLKWLWSFRGACTPRHEAYCMDVLARMGWDAAECFEKIVRDENLSCGYRQRGWIEVFRTNEGMQLGEHDAAMLRERGYNCDILSGSELIAREPAFQQGVIGAVHYTDSAFADPNQFLSQLAERAEGLGVRTLYNTRVVDLQVRNGRCVGVRTEPAVGRLDADSVVLAAGAWTTALARTIKVRVPMQPGKGYHRNIATPEPCVTTAVVLAERHIAVTPMPAYLRLSGTMEFSGMNHKLAPHRLNMLTAGASAYLHGIDESECISEWCGLRPCTPDGLPVVGWAPGVEGVFVATGHARMGFTLGPITGRLASEAMLDGETSIDITALRADRF